MEPTLEQDVAAVREDEASEAALRVCERAEQYAATLIELRQILDITDPTVWTQDVVRALKDGNDRLNKLIQDEAVPSINQSSQRVKDATKYVHDLRQERDEAVEKVAALQAQLGVHPR